MSAPERYPLFDTGQGIGVDGGKTLDYYEGAQVFATDDVIEFLKAEAAAAEQADPGGYQANALLDAIDKIDPPGWRYHCRDQTWTRREGGNG